MARVTASSIESYLAALPPAAQVALSQVIAAIRKGVPGAEESISYAIPTFKLQGRPVIYCAAFTSHYSLYPATASVIAAVGAALAPGEYNGKGTIRFPLDRPVPRALITRITTLRAAEEAARMRGRRVAAKKR